MQSRRSDHPSTGRWRFWVDRGGTFTDLVAMRPDGSLVTHKLLSDDPTTSQDAALLGIRRLMGLDSGDPLPCAGITEVRMGTTVGTNALLERGGEPTALAITRGFADAPRIGYQERPDIFALKIELPELLHERVVEIDERVRADGTSEEPLDEAAARAALAAAREAGLRSVAIALMHGYRYPHHESRLAAIARELGFTQISLSHETIPLVKLVGRAETTVVDAYLSPILRRYVDTIADDLGAHAGSRDDGDGPSHAGAESAREGTAPRLFFMQSHGGLTDAHTFRGKDSILSGPAGGIVGAVETCRRAGYEELITFDMGGTSTDVAHYAGSYERSLESTVGGIRLRSPMLRIHTVAAGGGSICRFAEGRYRVGPRSAGADPGPACYRRSGPLTVTDCNVVVGKIRPEHFPPVFGPDGDQTIDPTASRARLDEVGAAMRAEGVEPGPPEELADDFLRVAVDNMARAIKEISTHRGYDVSDYTLCCFGAAGGQHACLVAESLGIRSILLHPYAGVLSAYGMGLASVRALRQRTVERPLEQDAVPDLTAALDGLAADAAEELVEQGSPRERIAVERRLLLKYEGADMTLPITWRTGDRSLDAMTDEFTATHRERYGFTMDEARLVVDAADVEAIDPGDAAQLAQRSPAPQPGDLSNPESDDPGVKDGRATHDSAQTEANDRRTAPDAAPTAAVATVYTAGRRRRAQVLDRADLDPGAAIEGPAIVFEPTSTTVVEPGWAARVLPGGELLLGRTGGGAARAAGDRERTAIEQETGSPVQAHSPTSTSRACSPLLLEVFNNLFMSCAEQMGAALQNTARSVNVKERLDFSCAIFDECGDLVANAPHLPVHLGSMGETVRAVLGSRGGRLRRGEAVLVNSPYHGGTHLPDLTVVSPVFADDPGTAERAGAAAEQTEATAEREGRDRCDRVEAPLFYVASRAHHADVGGITPGSMPPDSRTIDDEGVLVRDLALVEGGRFRERELVELFSSGSWPARNVPQNVADLKAQVAANARGAAELRRMLAHFGEDEVRAYVGFMRHHAETSVRRALSGLEGGSFECLLDDGDRIVVDVCIDRDAGSARIDFTGTSPQRPDNFNAPRAVTVAAVIYTVRTLVDVEIPLNEGCLTPLELVIPDGCLLAASHPAAVVAGNVEISQLVTDALLGAFGVLAGSQGTMNNLTFGDGAHQYYETICGGVGAGHGFAGCSAVHSHMTNSRLTDPEVLEWRHPVVVEEFAVRGGSGGRGRWRGGDGARRRLRFLAPMTAAMLSGRRRVAPHGLDGGKPGACGRNLIVRADGTVEDIGGVDRRDVAAGDALLIETPGGGGFGRPSSE